MSAGGGVGIGEILVRLGGGCVTCELEVRVIGCEAERENVEERGRKAAGIAGELECRESYKLEIGCRRWIRYHGLV
jgi:hypothetical protein